MNERDMRAKVRCLEREAANLRMGALGVLVLAAAVNTTLFGTTRHWKDKYQTAVQIEQEAIAAYAELTARTEAEQAARAEAEAAFAALEGYTYLGSCTVSHYCCEDYNHICNDGDTITASGLPVQPGMVAVDPEVIPLGSRVIINGTSYLAADTGVKGRWIDVAVPTHEEAQTRGVYTANVWIMEE